MSYSIHKAIMDEQITNLHSVSYSNPTMPNTFNRANVVILVDAVVHRAHQTFVDKIASCCTRAAIVEIPQGEPKRESIRTITTLASVYQPESIISIGGGTAIDTAKGVCVGAKGGYQLPHSYEPRGRFLQTLPHAAIPTTSGPGAELSPAMIYSVECRNKVAIVDDRLIPDHILLIPELSLSLPQFESTFCVLDGISHSIESIMCDSCSGEIRLLATQALSRFLSNLNSLHAKPHNLRARRELQTASLESSYVLRACSVGLPHALATAVAPCFTLPHGVLITVSLDAVLQMDAQSTSTSTFYKRLSCALGYESFLQFARQISHYSQIIEASFPAMCEQSKTHIDVKGIISAVMSDNRVKNHISRVSKQDMSNLVCGYLRRLESSIASTTSDSIRYV